MRMLGRGRMTGRGGREQDEIIESGTRFRLLRAGTTGSAPMPPLEVECKSLWRPCERCTRVLARSRVSRTLDRNAAPVRSASRLASRLFSISKLTQQFRVPAGVAV